MPTEQDADRAGEADTPEADAPRTDTPVAPRVIGLVIAIVLTTVVWYPPLLGPLLPEDLVWRNLAQQGIDWAFALTLIGIAVLWERRPLSSLGFKKLTAANFAGGLGLGGFVMVGVGVWWLLTGALGPADASMGGPVPAGGSGADELPAGFFSWYAPIALITAGFCEELIYRGYAMERLYGLFKSPWPALLLPHAAFSLMHIKDGWDKVLLVATGGFLFVWWYHKHRDLTMNIIGHLFVDAMAVIGGLVFGR